MYQQTIVIGRVGGDCQPRYTPDSTPVGGFSVAVSRKWNDAASGEKKEQTTWFRVTCWRKLAEVCGQYVKKGMLIMVQGEMQDPKPWQDREGTWRAGLDLRADNVKFLSSKREVAAEGEEETDPKPKLAGADIKDVDEDEIPFN